MKRLLLIICSIIINVAVLAQTQAPTPPKYALLEFLKIEPGKNTDYRKDERDVWMPVHRERVKAGAIKSWSQWIVRYPGGVAREYDVVLITTFDKFADLENPYPAVVFANYLKENPEKKVNDVMAYTGSLRKTVRTELVQLDASANYKPGSPPAKFAAFWYQHSDVLPTIRTLVQQYWQPFHQEKANRGLLNSYAFCTMKSPTGTGCEYNSISMSFYDKFADLETFSPPGVWEKVHPNTKAADINAQTNAARKLVRTEWLNLGDYVQ